MAADIGARSRERADAIGSSSRMFVRRPSDAAEPQSPSGRRGATLSTLQELANDVGTAPRDLPLLLVDLVGKWIMHQSSEGAILQKGDSHINCQNRRVFIKLSAHSQINWPIRRLFLLITVSRN